MAIIYVLPNDFNFRHFPSDVRAEIVYETEEEFCVYISSISKLGGGVYLALKLSARAIKNIGRHPSNLLLGFKEIRGDHWVIWKKEYSEAKY